MGVRDRLGTTVFMPFAPLTPEKVAKDTNTPLKELLDWREQERKALDKEICKEYQKKLERAEDLIMAACQFAMINTFWGLYKIKFNADKVVDKFAEEINLAMNNGIIDSARRAEKATGLQFCFEDMDLNHEFHLGDWKQNKKISEMKSNEAYDEGFDNASILGNIINTAIFADQLYERGFEVSEIQMLITQANNKARQMRVGKRRVTEFAENLKKKGIDLGAKNFEILEKFNL